jgi:trehalose 6-phosphate synthase/phosphatase
LGADLVAFHTNEYAHDFLNCVNRVLKIDGTGHEIPVEERMVRINVFPMGIDFRGIRAMALSEHCAAVRNMIAHDLAGYKIVLSIDRLDYTKGILNRLIAFDRLLEDNPAWRGKVLLMLVVAPSRREIGSYLQIKRSIDEWVGKINGTYGTHTWAPVIYQYRQIDGEDLCALYGVSDIALVTPFKDGMNLIAKEFIASHTDGRGVLVLSEMAGAFQELGGAIGVNPFRIEELVKAILQGLTMTNEEQYARSEPMLRRLENYDVLRWAEDIMEATLINSRINTYEDHTKFLDLTDRTKPGNVCQQSV